MAFTQVTVTGSWQSGGAPLSGTVTFTLCQPLQNGDVIAPATPIVETLNAQGAISVQLYATDDPGTVPQGVWYGVTEQIVGCQPRDYFIQVPHATSPVDISTLMPGQTGWL